MGVTTRDLGGLPAGYTTGSRIKMEAFVRFDFPAPLGTIRYTTKRDGYTGNIDGTVKTWQHYDTVASGMGQGMQSWLEVTWISVANVNKVWTPIALDYEIEDRPVSVYLGQFDPDNFAVLSGKQFLHGGRVEAIRVGRRRVLITIKPHRFPISTLLPGWKLGSHCAYVAEGGGYKGLLCGYVGALATCDGTYDGPNGCVAHGNQPRFGGARFLPKAGEEFEMGFLGGS